MENHRNFRYSVDKTSFYGIDFRELKRGENWEERRKACREGKRKEREGGKKYTVRVELAEWMEPAD